MPKPIGVLLDENLAKDTREYLDTLNIPPDDNFVDRVDRMIEDMRKEKERGK
jgi:hypothetical protein